jgi:hypothetical protein
MGTHEPPGLGHGCAALEPPLPARIMVLNDSMPHATYAAGADTAPVPSTGPTWPPASSPPAPALPR